MTAPILDMHKLGVALQKAGHKKTWALQGIVTDDDGNAYEYVYNKAGKLVDVIVDVKLIPIGHVVGCKLSGLGGGALGIWAVPPVGAEVAVLLPQGTLNDEPIIVGGLPTDVGPADLDGTTIVIAVPVNGKVKVHAGGTTKALAYQEDLEAVNAKLGSHGHTYADDNGTTVTAKTTGAGESADISEGTTVLEAE